ncbi:hypothetical protein GCM10009691_21450 [Brevibacterium picturae]|uniref:Uncharacterized protein n=1 Tax=Brevibacterium picturae TaxID=260553 RepID=A0ABN2BSD7_9MICO
MVADAETKTCSSRELGIGDPAGSPIEYRTNERSDRLWLEADDVIDGKAGILTCLRQKAGTSQSIR